MSGTGIFPNDQWTLAAGHGDAGPMFVRYRPGEPDPVEKAKFTYMVIATWPFEPSNQSGLPTSETLDAMGEFEERILDTSDRDAWWGSLVAIMTHDGTREWRFYTPDVGTFVQEFNQALSGMGPYPIQLQAFKDPDWTGLVEVRHDAR